MNITINSVAMPEPHELLSEYVTVSGKLLRQVRLTYRYATAVQTMTILENATKLTPVAVSYTHPATNAAVSFSASCYTASAAVLREMSGALHYAPLVVTMREVAP